MSTPLEPAVAPEQVISTHDASLYNEDLAPVPKSKRTWGIYNYASLWVAMSVCIPTYMLASGLITGGMSWLEAIGTILLGNLIVLVPMILNAHAGTKYGIPFPVLVRSSFGVRGANIPAVLRALVACGWFGIQCWIGGQAIYSMLVVLAPSMGHFAPGKWGLVCSCFSMSREKRAVWALCFMVDHISRHMLSSGTSLCLRSREWWVSGPL
jgi:NCS1 family nucleobase:cation symporter-1